MVDVYHGNFLYDLMNSCINFFFSQRLMRYLSSMFLFRDILLMETGFLTIIVSPLILFKSSNQDRYGTISKYYFVNIRILF